MCGVVLVVVVVVVVCVLVFVVCGVCDVRCVWCDTLNAVRLYLQNVPVCTGTTSKCGRFECTHRGVLDGHGVEEGEGGVQRATPHTPQPRPRRQQHTATHHNTAHHDTTQHNTTQHRTRHTEAKRREDKMKR